MVFTTAGGGANQLDTGYEISNSLRFNDDDSARLLRAQSNGDQDKWTWSGWVKRSNISSTQCFFATTDGSATSFDAKFDSSDRIEVYNYFGGGFDSKLVSNRVFRDVGAWYHIVVGIDVTQSSNSDKIKIYVNGVQETSFGTDNTVANADKDWNNTQAHSVGRSGAYNSQYFDGYLTEVVNIDGTQLDATSFGEFDDDTGIWKPKDVSGLTFGTNGFYLDFENSGSLGADVSGNGNNFTVQNLTSVDQSTDTCTNNAITMNPLDDVASSTYSEGNLKVVTSASGSAPHFTTFGLTTGKWYWEVKATSFTEHSDGYITIGITGNQGNSSTSQLGNLSGDYAFVNNLS